MVTGVESIYGAYRELLSLVDEEFNRVRDMFIDRMQCRKGCSSCCHQLFPINAIEAAYISQGVRELEPDVQDGMRLRASAYLEELTGAEVDPDQTIEDHSRVGGTGARQPGRASPHPLPGFGGRRLLDLQPPARHGPQVWHTALESQQPQGPAGLRVELQAR